MSAEFRSVHTRMWREDEWFQGLPTDARLLFIYLFTNPSASVSGIYRLPLRTIEFESGIPGKRVKELLAQFSGENKVHCEDGVVWVVRMRENQLPGREVSAKIAVHLESEIAKIPPCRIKTMYLMTYGYPISGAEYPIDTVSIPDRTDTDTYTVTDTVTDTIAPSGAPSSAKPKAVKVAGENGNGQNGNGPVKVVTDQQAMFAAIAEVCELDPKLQASRIGKVAKDLIGAGYAPADVAGFRDWWLSDSWRASHTPVPTVAKLTENLQRFRNEQDNPRLMAATLNGSSGDPVDAFYSIAQRSNGL